jgi:hypothetical protein
VPEFIEAMNIGVLLSNRSLQTIYFKVLSFYALVEGRGPNTDRYVGKVFSVIANSMNKSHPDAIILNDLRKLEVNGTIEFELIYGKENDLKYNKAQAVIPDCFAPRDKRETEPERWHIGIRQRVNNIINAHLRQADGTLWHSNTAAETRPCPTDLVGDRGGPTATTRDAGPISWWRLRLNSALSNPARRCCGTLVAEATRINVRSLRECAHTRGARKVRRRLRVAGGRWPQRGRR